MPTQASIPSQPQAHSHDHAALVAAFTKHNLDLDAFLKHERITAAQLIALARSMPEIESLRPVQALAAVLDSLSLQSARRRALTDLTKPMQSADPAHARRAAIQITRLHSAAAKSAARLELAAINSKSRTDRAATRLPDATAHRKAEGL